MLSLTDATLSRVNEYLQGESAFSAASLNTLWPVDQYLVFAVSHPVNEGNARNACLQKPVPMPLFLSTVGRLCTGHG